MHNSHKPPLKHILTNKGVFVRIRTKIWVDAALIGYFNP